MYLLLDIEREQEKRFRIDSLDYALLTRFGEDGGDEAIFIELFLKRLSLNRQSRLETFALL